MLIDSTGLKVYGAGELLAEKHGTRARRCWRKLHLAVDANTNMIVASVLTEKEVDDQSQVQALLDQISGIIAQVTADGAYDGEPTYQTIAVHGADIAVVIPPRVMSGVVAMGSAGAAHRNMKQVIVSTIPEPQCYALMLPELESVSLPGRHEQCRRIVSRLARRAFCPAAWDAGLRAGWCICDDSRNWCRTHPESASYLSCGLCENVCEWFQDIRAGHFLPYHGLLFGNL